MTTDEYLYAISDLRAFETRTNLVGASEQEREEFLNKINVTRKELGLPKAYPEDLTYGFNYSLD